MLNRRSLLAVLAAAVLVAVALGSGVGVLLGGDPDGSPTTADAPADHDAPTPSVPGRTEGGSGTSHRGSETMPEPSADASATGRSEAAETDGTDRADSAPGGTTSAGGVTVVPEGSGPASDYALPDLEPAASTPQRGYALPTKAAFARGRLVHGYPTRLLPSAPRSAVVTSSVSPAGQSVQVALVGERRGGSTAMLRFYRTRLTGAGFREVSVDAVGGATAAAFRRGAERVVVTADADPARTYSVYATLVAGGA